MTVNASKRTRAIGFTLVGAGLFLALPLTASKAIEYVDAAAPAAPRAPAAPLAPKAHSAPMLLAAQVAPPVGPTAPAPPSRVSRINVTNDDTVTINGVTKRWEDLTPQERARIRADIGEARRDLKREMDRLPHELAKVQRDMAHFRNGEFQREMAQAREEVRRSMQEVDREMRSLKAAGVDPEEIKAELAASLAEIEKIDVDKIVREALASVDMDRMRADLHDAGQSLDDIEDQLDEHDDE